MRKEKKLEELRFLAAGSPIPHHIKQELGSCRGSQKMKEKENRGTTFSFSFSVLWQDYRANAHKDTKALAHKILTQSFFFPFLCQGQLLILFIF
jgi:hypothetical protein